MSSKHTAHKREFEHALLEVLEQDYNLQVRADGDHFERRTRGVASLQFQYEHDTTHPKEAKVVVTVAGVEEFSYTLFVDLSKPASIRESAECCEDLAEALVDYSLSMDDALEEALWCGDFTDQRYED